jgi:peroxiredoxin
VPDVTQRALSLVFAVVVAALTTCAPRAAPVAALTTAKLRDRLEASGLSVPKQPMIADDFELSTLEGAKVKLSSYRGKVVFLNFWATWCPPCRGEMASMEKLWQRFGDRGLEIVAVDLKEAQATVSKFVKDNSLTFAVLLDADAAVGSGWGVQSIPTTYLIDRKGGILARTIGGREWDTPEMLSLFEAILAAK